MSVDVQFNVDQALAKLGELVEKHGPQAVDLAAQVLQVSAAGQLMIGALFVTGAAISGTVCVKASKEGQRRQELYETWDRQNDEWRYRPGRTEAERPVKPSDADYEFMAFVVAASALVTALLIICASFALIDTWAWVAVFNPKLALAHQILSKLGAM